MRGPRPGGEGVRGCRDSAFLYNTLLKSLLLYMSLSQSNSSETLCVGMGTLFHLTHFVLVRGKLMRCRQVLVIRIYSKSIKLHIVKMSKSTLGHSHFPTRSNHQAN